MRSLMPSVTVKESGDILSLEEKFQGGTGINLTPPPLSIMRLAHGLIEMPVPPPELLIFEPFIETDDITIVSKTTNENERLLWEGSSRWVEITVGVIGKRGSMRSLMPSVTVKESGDILSLEEIFQVVEQA
nr:ATP-grasp fold [Tanacetum cinerariifolium]